MKTRKTTRKTRYNHYIVGRDYAERFGDTSTRQEVIMRGEWTDVPGWVCIGCCGFHEIAEESTLRDIETEV